ncbi:MAG: hypothetical protein HFG15_01095 [Bacilli bacterium]|nr:hypothetical protein [Bacilli bacterium]
MALMIHYSYMLLLNMAFGMAMLMLLEKKKPRLWFHLIWYSVITTIVQVYCAPVLSLPVGVLFFIMNIMFYPLILSETVKRSILATIYLHCLLILLDIGITILYVIVGKTVFSPFMILLCNLLLGSLLLIIIHHPRITQFGRYIVNYDGKNNLVLFFCFFLGLYVMLLVIQLKVFQEGLWIALFIFIMTFVFCFLVIKYVWELRSQEQLKQERELIMKSLAEYEKIMSHIQIEMHENKNILAVMRSLVDRNQSEAIAYIDELLKEQDRAKTNVLYQFHYIPFPSLRALLYQKVYGLCEEQHKIITDISKDLLNYDFTNISSLLLNTYFMAISTICDLLLPSIKADSPIVFTCYIDHEKLYFVTTILYQDLDYLTMNNDQRKKSDPLLNEWRILEKLIAETKQMTIKKEVVGQSFSMKLGLALKENE